VHVREDVGHAVIEAETILKMIEMADQADMAALDRIDGRVWCWFSDCEYIGHDKVDQYNYMAKPKMGDGAGFYKSVNERTRYTRSRDALKVIRPDGWFMNGYYALACGSCAADSNYQFVIERVAKGTGIRMISPKLATEELAELHAYIQAIAYERMSAETPASPQPVS
jgi:hypothetical protein